MRVMLINIVFHNFFFQTAGVEVCVKSVNIPETSDSVVSLFNEKSLQSKNFVKKSRVTDVSI